MKKIGLLFMLVVFLVGCSSGQIDSEKLAKCLTEKGAIMYGTEWCSHCQAQKTEFGADFQYVNYVDCDKNIEKCIAAGVTGYPTWVINEQNYPGGKALTTLVKLSGC